MTAFEWIVVVGWVAVVFCLYVVTRNQTIVVERLDAVLRHLKDQRPREHAETLRLLEDILDTLVNERRPSDKESVGPSKWTAEFQRAMRESPGADPETVAQEIFKRMFEEISAK